MCWFLTNKTVLRSVVGIGLLEVLGATPAHATVEGQPCQHVP